MVNKILFVSFGFLTAFLGFSKDLYVYDLGEKHSNELTVYAHRNEVVFYQTVMPGIVRAEILQGESCAVETPLRQLVGTRQVTTEARIVPHTMGNLAGQVCTVLLTDGVYQSKIRILYR